VKNTIFFGTLHSYYLETLESTIKASLAQWQSTSLVDQTSCQFRLPHLFFNDDCSFGCLEKCGLSISSVPYAKPRLR
jgi:hypothetical protein